MTSPRRIAAVLAALAFLALGAAGCGVKGDDTASTDSGTTPTTLDADPSTTEGSGSSDDEPSTTEPRSDDEPSTTEPGSDDGPTDASIPDDFSEIPGFQKDQLTELYTDMGLSQEQSECLVDAILDMGNQSDFDPSDMSAMFDLFENCDISLEDLGNIGSGQFSPGN